MAEIPNLVVSIAEPALLAVLQSHFASSTLSWIDGGGDGEPSG
jgi:hypothetical protein